MDGHSTTKRRLRPLIVSITVVAAAALAFGATTLRHTAERHGTPPQPTTLEAALAAFGGQTDLFLKLSTVPGDSTNANHPKDIDVATLSWGLTNSAGTSTGASFSTLTITKGIDSASPKLFVGSAKGTAYATAIISADRTGEHNDTFATLTLGTVKIASFKQVADRTNGFTETITLKFSKATLSFKPQKIDGSLGSAVTGCWNLVSHAGC